MEARFFETYGCLPQIRNYDFKIQKKASIVSFMETQMHREDESIISFVFCLISLIWEALASLVR